MRFLIGSALAYFGVVGFFPAQDPPPAQKPPPAQDLPPVKDPNDKSPTLWDWGKCKPTGPCEYVECKCDPIAGVSTDLECPLKETVGERTFDSPYHREGGGGVDHHTWTVSNEYWQGGYTETEPCLWETGDTKYKGDIIDKVKDRVLKYRQFEMNGVTGVRMGDIDPLDWPHDSAIFHYEILYAIESITTGPGVMARYEIVYSNKPNDEPYVIETLLTPWELHRRDRTPVPCPPCNRPYTGHLWTEYFVRWALNVEAIQGSKAKSEEPTPEDFSIAVDWGAIASDAAGEAAGALPGPAGKVAKTVMKAFSLGEKYLKVKRPKADPSKDYMLFYIEAKTRSDIDSPGPEEVNRLRPAASVSKSFSESTKADDRERAIESNGKGLEGGSMAEPGDKAKDRRGNPMSGSWLRWIQGLRDSSFFAYEQIADVAVINVSIGNSGHSYGRGTLYLVGIPTRTSENPCKCGNPYPPMEPPTDGPPSAVAPPDDPGHARPSPDEPPPDPAPGSRTECVPSKNRKKIQKDVEQYFGINDVIVPLPEGVEKVSIEAPSFGNATARVSVIVDEGAAKTGETPVAAKTRSDGKTVVEADSSAQPELIVVSPVNFGTWWNRVKFVKETAPADTKGREGIRRLRNPSDLGTKKVEMGPFKDSAGTYRTGPVTLDFEATTSSPTTDINLVKGDRTLASFEESFAVRAGDRTSRIGSFALSGKEAFDTFVASKSDDLAVRLKRADGTSVDVSINALAPQGLATGLDTPQITVPGSVRAGEKFDVTVVGANRSIERKRGLPQKTIRTTAWVVNPDGSKTLIVDTLEEGAVKGSATAPAKGEMRFAATHEVDSEASKSQTEAATKAMQTDSQLEPDVQQLLPGPR